MTITFTFLNPKLDKKMLDITTIFKALIMYASKYIFPYGDKHLTRIY